MKFHTIRMTRTCDYCGIAITYRKEENLRAADERREHLHNVCHIARDKEKLIRRCECKPNTNSLQRKENMTRRCEGRLDTLQRKEIIMERYINRTFERTEHDEYVLLVERYLEKNEETIVVLDYNGNVIGWLIKSRYEQATLDNVKIVPIYL